MANKSGSKATLTKKQEKFVSELIKGKSQREAYKKAYDASRMKDTTIDSKASILFKDEKVRARFDELKGKVVARAEEKTIMSALEVLKEIESIAKTDISDFLDFRTEKTLVGQRGDEPIYGYAPIVDLKDSRTVDTKNISEISVGSNGTFKFKTYNRDAALYKMLEVYGENAVAKAKQRLAEERFLHDKEIDGLKYF